MEPTQNTQIAQGIDWNSLIYWGLTILITNLATWYISNQKSKYNFKLEYHKMIIEKRMKAYDELQALINELDQSFVYNITGGPVTIHYIFDKNDLTDIKAVMLKTFKSSLWFSNEVNQIYSRLNKLLNVIDELYRLKSSRGLESYIKEYSFNTGLPIRLDADGINKNRYITPFSLFGYLFYNELDGIIVEMRRIVSVDLKNFYKVEDFLENQSPR